MVGRWHPEPCPQLCGGVHGQGRGTEGPVALGSDEGPLQSSGGRAVPPKVLAEGHG